MPRSYYRTGDWNAICDVCGRKFKASQMLLRWDGFRVCKPDFELRHPADFIRGVFDDPSIPWSRPEQETGVVLGVNFSQQVQLFSTNPQSFEYMGYDASMDADGNTLLLASHRRDTLAQGANNQDQRFAMMGLNQAILPMLPSPDGDIGSNDRRMLLNTYPFAAESLQDTGGAYIFTRSGTTWTQEVLLSGDMTAGSLLGFKVDISADGNTAVAGAPYDSTTAGSQGSVVVWTRSSGVWSEEQKITYPTTPGATNIFFGYDVSIANDGNTMVIGAIHPSAAGEAFIYTRTSGVWSLAKTLNYTGVASGDLFGSAVAISGDGLEVIVAARQSDATGYCVEWSYTSSWIEGSKIVSPVSAAGEQFGFQIQLNYDGSYAFIGAPYATVDTLEIAGRFEIFRRTTGTLLFSHTIVSPSPEAYAYFGARFDIDLNGTTIIIGEGDKDFAAVNSGIAHSYSREGDTTEYNIALSVDNASAGDYYGYGIAISDDGSYAAVTAVDDDATQIDQGSAYIFTK